MPTPFEAGKTAKKLEKANFTTDLSTLNVRSACCDAPMMLFKDKFNLCSRCHKWKDIRYNEPIQASGKVQPYIAEPVRDAEVYEPRVGDRVVMEAVVMMVTPDLSGPQLVVEHKRNDGEKLYIKVFASDMYLLSREIRSLTKIRGRSLTHGEARQKRED